MSFVNFVTMLTIHDIVSVCTFCGILIESGEIHHQVVKMCDRDVREYRDVDLTIILIDTIHTLAEPNRT